MSLKFSSRFLLLAAGMAAAGVANATILVSTGFEGYPASGNVATTSAPATGDVGIATDAWAGSNWSWQGTGLSYTDANGTISGGNRALDYTGSNFQVRQVNVSASAAIAQTVFIRYLAKLDAVPTGTQVGVVGLVTNNDVSNNNNNIFPGFGIYAGGPSVTNGTNSNQFYIQDGGNFGVSTSVSPTMLFGGTAGNGVNLMVGRLTWDSGLNRFATLDVWVNPVNGDLASPDATRSLTTSVTSLTEMVFRAGGTNGGPRSVMDEFVIATTWADVVPVPEPATFALLGGFAALGLVLYRRRAR